MPDTALVVIARAPESGKVKSRLAADLGEESTLRVYSAMLKKLFALGDAWSGPVGLLARGDSSAWNTTAMSTWPRRAQKNGSLGKIIRQGLEWGLEMSPNVLAIGSDCPLLESIHLMELKEKLEKVDAVFGPALDGGYWAIGVSNPSPLDALCADDLPWSKPDLLEVSLQRLQNEGLSHDKGTPLPDCDTVKDLLDAERKGFHWK